MSAKTDNKDITKPKYTSTQIANFFLIMAEKDKVEMTCLKLVKLVYFAYAWSLVAFEEQRLFPEPIIAGKNGPIVASIYNEFKKFGDKAIPIGEFSTNLDPDNDAVKDQFVIGKGEHYAVVKMLAIIWEEYKYKTGRELSDITHEKNAPWKGVNLFERIDDEKIKQRARLRMRTFIEKKREENKKKEKKEKICTSPANQAT